MGTSSLDLLRKDLKRPPNIEGRLAWVWALLVVPFDLGVLDEVAALGVVGGFDSGLGVEGAAYGL